MEGQIPARARPRSAPHAPPTLPPVATFDSLADLPLEIEGYELEGLELQIPGFERLSTVTHIRGGGEEGLGRAVPYHPVPSTPRQAAGAWLDLPGPGPWGEFCDFRGGVHPFPAEPQRDV